MQLELCLWLPDLVVRYRLLCEFYLVFNLTKCQCRCMSMFEFSCRILILRCLEKIHNKFKVVRNIF